MRRANLSPNAAPGAVAPDPLQQDAQARPDGDRSLTDLPREILDVIVRRTIADETTWVSARQLALLQRVNHEFNTVASNVLHGGDHQDVGRVTTREQIAQLAHQPDLDSFRAGMRSVVSEAPDVGIRLRSLPDRFRGAALDVLRDQTHLRSLELDASYAPEMVQETVAAMEYMLPRNPQLRSAGLNLNLCHLTDDQIADIAGRPQLATLTSLEVGGNAIGDAGVAALADSEMARSLTSLRLRNNRGISSQGAESLANSPNLAALTSLDLCGNHRVGNTGAIALVNSPHLKLKSLDLSYCGIGDEGVTALVNSPMAGSLTSLALCNNRDITAEGVTTLANSRQLKLTSLDLGGCDIGDTGVTTLANSEMAKSLTALHLQYNNLTCTGVRAVTDSANMANLTALHLQGNRSMSSAGGISLANSRHLTLRTLDLTDCNLGDAGATILANSDRMANLSSLELGKNRLGDEGTRALAGSPYLGSLTVLTLRENRIGNAGATALANSTNLRALAALDIGSNRIGDRGARALANSTGLSLSFLGIQRNSVGAESARALRARISRVLV